MPSVLEEFKRERKTRLNMAEARNALARAVFFNRQGEVRDRTFENQLTVSFGLRIVFHYGASLSDGQRLGFSLPPV
jgi:TnpA family transposase